MRGAGDEPEGKSNTRAAAVTNGGHARALNNRTLDNRIGPQRIRTAAEQRHGVQEPRA